MTDLSHHRVWRILGISIGLIVFVYLASQAAKGIGQITTYELSVNPVFLGLSFLGQIVGVTVSIWVWRSILSTFDISLPFLSDFTMVNLSTLGRKIPGTIWYALGRVSLYRRHGQSVTGTSLAIVYELVALSLAGLIAVTIGVAGGAFSSVDPFARTLLVLGMLAISTFGLLYFPRVIHTLAGYALRAANLDIRVEAPLTSARVALKWVVGELAVIFCGSLVVFFLFKAVQPIISVPLTYLFALWGVIAALGPLVVLLPVIIGLRDGLTFFLLSIVLPRNMAALATLLWRIWVLFLELLLGLASGVFIALETPGERVQDD